MRKFIEVFTTAPIEYDYGCSFSAISERSDIVGYLIHNPKKLIRRVMVLESQEQLQRGRYGSGLYVSWNYEELFKELHEKHSSIVLGIPPAGGNDWATTGQTNLPTIQGDKNG